jgi:hypothetical protein
VIVCRPSAPRRRPARPLATRSVPARAASSEGCGVQNSRMAEAMASSRARSSSVPRAALLWPERVTPVRRPGRVRAGRWWPATPHRWRELIHQEVRRADGTATPLHRWVRRYRRPFDLTWPYGSAWERIRPSPPAGTTSTSSRQHLVPCLWPAADRAGLVPAGCLESDRGWMLPPLRHPLRGAVRGAAGGLGPPPAARGPSPTPPAALGPRGIVLEPSGLPLAARDGEARVIEDDPAQREQQHRSIVAGDPDGLLGRARARLPGGAVVA